MKNCVATTPLNGKECQTGLFCMDMCHREVVDQPLCPSPTEGERNSQKTALFTISQDLLGSFSITLSRKLLFLLSEV